MLSCKYYKIFQEISVWVCPALSLDTNLWILENMKNTGWFLALFTKCFVPGRCLGLWLRLCVWDWGRADAAGRCNDDEAVFVVVAVLSLAACWSGWRRQSVVATQVRGIMERAE